MGLMVSDPILIRALTVSQARCRRTTGTYWPTQLDTRANRYLPVWASTDNAPRETVGNLRDLVKV